MKKLLLLTAILGFTVCSNLRAQSASDEFEIQAFTRHFMVAYNQQDDATLQKMYLEDAVRMDANGQKIQGASQIAAYFAQQFVKDNTTLLLKPSKITWSDYQHAYVASGTYEIYGNTHVYDLKIHDTGAYANVMIKKDGDWKIANSVLSPLVKVMVYHQVKDFAEWKSVFEQGQPMRSAAGELSSEIGTLHDDPNTAYVISEWTSLEQFQTFMADPDLTKAMQQAGVTGKPTVLILDRQ